MKVSVRSCSLTAAICAVPFIFLAVQLAAQGTRFHNAPPSSAQLKNPYTGQHAGVVAGSKLYSANCSSCHGVNGRGTGNVPALSQGPTQSASDGEVFWFITTGSVNNGMPAWTSLAEQKRWQIVTYLKSLKGSQTSAAAESTSSKTTPVATNAPPPPPPFMDFRYEQPGKVHKITTQDLPAPYATESAGNGPKVVPRPDGMWPKAPDGFTVQQYATGLDNPRAIRTAPNGDFFLAESSSGKIKVFRGVTRDGKPEQTNVFATGLNQPYGIAFYPPGENPQWVYIGNTDAVIRFSYRNGDLKASGPAHEAATRRRAPPRRSKWRSTRASNSRLNIGETSLHRSTAHGTDRCAWDTK